MESDFLKYFYFWPKINLVLFHRLEHPKLLFHWKKYRHFGQKYSELKMIKFDRLRIYSHQAKVRVKTKDQITTKKDQRKLSLSLPFSLGVNGP